MTNEPELWTCEEAPEELTHSDREDAIEDVLDCG